MPKGNKTGPEGRGPQTGRGFGFCAGHSDPGYTKSPGMGMERGYCGGRGRRGGGWGRGRRYYSDIYLNYPDMTPPRHTHLKFINSEDESKYLEQILTNLKGEIEVIEKRLQEITEAMKE